MNETAFQRAWARFCNLWFGADHGSIEYCLRHAILEYEQALRRDLEFNAERMIAGEKAADEGRTRPLRAVIDELHNRYSEGIPPSDTQPR